MQISTNLYYDRSKAQFNVLQTQVDKLQTQISTGKKVQAPSDDAVSYQRLQNLTVGTADDTAWASNINLARTILSQADTTLGSITDRLQGLQELAVQANNGTLSGDDRKILATQVRAAIDDLVALANTTDVRGQPLFGAATGSTAVSVDPSGTVSFTGTGQPAGIPIGQGTSVQTSETAERIFGNVPISSGTTDVFALLDSFATALEGGSTVPADVLDGLKAAGNQITSVRGVAGARSARLELEAGRIQETQTTRTASRSDIEDVDVPSAIADLQKLSTVLQATQASFSKFSQLSLFDYLR